MVPPVSPPPAPLYAASTALATSSTSPATLLPGSSPLPPHALTTSEAISKGSSLSEGVFVGAFVVLFVTMLCASAIFTPNVHALLRRHRDFLFGGVVNPAQRLINATDGDVVAPVSEKGSGKPRRVHWPRFTSKDASPINEPSIGME
jgi:hypothetical protein